MRSRFNTRKLFSVRSYAFCLKDKDKNTKVQTEGTKHRQDRQISWFLKGLATADRVMLRILMMLNLPDTAVLQRILDNSRSLLKRKGAAESQLPFCSGCWLFVRLFSKLVSEKMSQRREINPVRTLLASCKNPRQEACVCWWARISTPTHCNAIEFFLLLWRTNATGGAELLFVSCYYILYFFFENSLLNIAGGITRKRTSPARNTRNSTTANPFSQNAACVLPTKVAGSKHRQYN